MKKNTIRAKGVSLLENSGTAVLIVGIIGGGVSILNGLMTGGEGYVFIGYGIGVIVAATLIYAFAKNIASVNQNIEVLKHYKILEYKDSQRMADDEHFDPLKD